MSFFRYNLPFNRKEIVDFLDFFLEEIIWTDFPTEENLSIFENQLKVILSKIYTSSDFDFKVNSIINFVTDLRKEAEKLVVEYFRNDPACKSEIEIVLSYPGYYATIVHRFAHFLSVLELPILPRVIAEIAHSRTGIDIHPSAIIGQNFYIDHGTGIVIGETTVIGDYVKIYQGVTLGAFYVSKDLANIKRHPTIGNNVTIYAGATILGGTTEIGDNVIIGGNVWITKSIPSDARVYQNSKPIVIEPKEILDKNNYSI